MTDAFTHLLRVRYSECDAQQVVFNAKYAEYADLAATEFFRAIWGGYEHLLERELDSQVVDLHISWRASAVFDDVLAIKVECSKVGTTSFVLRMPIINQISGAEIASCEIAYVMVDAKQFTKVAIPDDVRQALNDGASGVVSNQSGLSLD